MTGLRPATTKRKPPATPPEIDTGDEALMISALLESGHFDPSPYGLTVEDLECWESLWLFCLNYEALEGRAPALALVQSKFPDFVHNEGVGVNYAAHALKTASHARQMRTNLGKAIAALQDNDLDGVHEVLEKVERPRINRKPPVDGFSHDNVAAEFAVSRIPIPHQSLGRVSGGMGTGELWYIAARPSNGKTYTACDYVRCAVQAGLTVGYVSCEMPAARINTRIARVLTNGDKRLLTLLASQEQADRKLALDELRERTSGSWSTVDPSHGRVTNGFVREQLYGKDLVVVDHVGLMRTNKGHRAIDDWRAMAEISNTLKEDNLAVGTPILGLVQISRSGESSSTKAPKGSTLSQSDALLQDCDVLTTMKRLSKHVMVHSAEKVREADTPRWYSKYDPARIDFREMTSEAAQALMLTDQSFDDED